jgi:DNA-binding transcriptional ArsR family regulator
MQLEDDLFRALADPSRRAIFEQLALGESAVKDLTARFDISQPAVSQHLATLRQAGLVSTRRQGRLAYYSIAPQGLKPLVSWIERYRAFWIDRVDRLKTLLEEIEE